MTIPRTLRKYIEAGRLDEVENAWLAQLEKNPDDLDFFVAAARALKGAGEEGAASTLLELLHEDLLGRDQHPSRLHLLREVGLLMQGAEDLHRHTLEVLGQVYAAFPSLAGLTEYVGLHRAIEDTTKNWTKVDQLEELLQFEVDSIVWMKGKGAGRVTEVNVELAGFKVDFERSPGLRVGFRGATKLMQSLKPEHILRRKIEDPEGLLALKAKDPAELLLTTLRSYEEARNATQIREALAGIVEPGEWSSWWAAARKNPQVVTEGKGARQSYRAAASSADAEDTVLVDFDRADNNHKLEIFRRNASRSAALRDALAERLIAIASRSRPSEIELRFAIANALRDSPELYADLPWAPEQLIEAAPTPTTLLAAITDRVLREGAYGLVREKRQDWREIFEDRLAREEEPKLLALIADALTGDAPDRLVAFYDRVLAQPRKQAAAFVWMAERAQDDTTILDRKPMRFLRALLASTQPAEIDPYRGRLKKLLEDGGPIAMLLQRVPGDQAESAEEVLKRSQLEEYVRTPLISSLHMRFPDLRPEAEAPLYALEASINERKAELKQLREVEIPTNRRAIEEARELGDLKENFEYKSARQRHEYLAARQGGLQNELARAQPIDLARTTDDEVRVATKVQIRSDGGPQELVILGPWESDPEAGVISYDSDLARALLGKKIGEVASFGGTDHEVVTIEVWSPS